MVTSRKGVTPVGCHRDLVRARRELVATGVRVDGAVAPGERGDFALRGNQVNPVIRALRNNGIYVTALHSHMLDATPTVFFMHFLATGSPLALAHGVRAGLDAIAANPPA